MALTQIKPNAVDSTQDFVFDSITIDGIVLSNSGGSLTVTGAQSINVSTGFDSGSHANSAFIKANSSYIQANAAFEKANQSYIVLSNSSTYIDGATMNVWGGSFDNYLFTTWAGAFNSNNSTALFTFGSLGSNVMSVQMDGSLFVGDNFITDALGVTPNLGGWIVASSGIKSVYNVYANVDVQAGQNLIAGGYVQFGDGTTQSTSANATIRYANSAFGVANSASSYANGAFASSNTKYSSSGGTISGDVSITGNLTISGNVFSVQATNLSVEDNMIFLNANSNNSNPDLGFSANYNDGTYAHAGLFRDASDGIWKFYYNYQLEPDASPYIDTTHASFRIANLTANIISDVVTIRGYDPLNYTNAAFAAANTADQKAVTSGDYANSSYGFSNTANQRAVTSGTYANAAFAIANDAYTVAYTVDYYANAAFSLANTANTNAATADQKAVISGSYANSAYGQANTANTNAATADQKAISAGVYANAAYAAANTGASATDSYARNHANSGYAQANTATTNAAIADQRAVTSGAYANSAYGQANTANTNAATADQKAVTSGDYANSAYSQSNTATTNTSTADQRAVTSGSYANSAYNQANTATTNAATADQKAISAGVYANAAYGAANTANTNAATADQRAVTSGVYANAAYALANTVSSASIDNYARPHATAAFNTANIADQRAVTSGSYANSAYSTANTKLSSSGGTISGDLNITGNLVVSGNATTISVSNIKVDDSLLQLAANNETSDALDIGFVGHYSDDAGVNQRHTGLFRDATDGLYYLFYNYEDPSFDTLTPNNTINISNSSFRVANLTANLISDVVRIRGYDPINHTNSVFVTANSASSYANSGYTTANSASSYANGAFAVANTANVNSVSAGAYANAAFNAANTSGSDSWARSAANSASSYANSAYVQANTANINAISSGSYANSGFAQANTADQKAVSAGVYANSGFTQANTGSTNAISAGSYANGAFAAANTRLSTSGGTISGDLTITGFTTLAETTEIVTALTGATGTVAHNLATGPIFLHSSVTANFTANFTNTPTTNDRSIVATLIVTQGATAYIPNAVQIDGVGQTINWVGGSAPTGGANKRDVFTFALIRSSSTWTVLGNFTSFG
jgi:hypothetical protein